MRPGQAWIGMWVRVHSGHRNRDLDGMIGTVMHIYGTSSGRTVLHVRLEDGRWQLLWPEEVEALTEEDGGEGT